MISAPDLAALLLLVFAALAAYDGVYVHLVALRLPARPASYAEHLWHTASAILFVPVAALLFVEPSSPSNGGAALWTGVAAAIAMYVVEIFDVRAEKASRAELGGLARGELAVHIGALVTRTAALALVVVPLPWSAWGLGGTAAAPASSFAQTVGLAALGGAIVIAAIHVVLALVHCPVCGPCRGARGGATG